MESAPINVTLQCPYCCFIFDVGMNRRQGRVFELLKCPQSPWACGQYFWLELRDGQPWELRKCTGTKTVFRAQDRRRLDELLRMARSELWQRGYDGPPPPQAIH